MRLPVGSLDRVTDQADFGEALVMIAGVEACMGLASCESPLKVLGISTTPKKSTLAYANANRPRELYESIFMQLLEKCQIETAAHSRRKFRFKIKLMSLDGSVIELSETMFDWAKYRRQKGAVKLHLLLDLDAVDRGYNDHVWFRHPNVIDQVDRWRLRQLKHSLPKWQTQKNIPC